MQISVGNSLRIVALGLCFTACSHRSAEAQVTRQEIALAQRYIELQAAPVSKDIGKFTGLTQPYAPLDFEVRHADGKHASDIRNVLFGYAGATAGLDDSQTPKMANDFHCGPPCATERVRSFLDQNRRVSALVKRFLTAGRVGIVSQWGVPGDLRINDTFVQRGTITTFSPLGAVGLLPNSQGKTSSNLVAATGLTASEIEEARAIAAELVALHLAAIVRSPQGIRVIRTGNSDNECGLLFKKVTVPEPKEGDDFGEGLEIVGITAIAQDIYYFETS